MAPKLNGIAVYQPIDATSLMPRPLTRVGSQKVSV